VTFETILTILTGAAVAGAYGLLVYARRRRQIPPGEDEPEAFNPYSLAATVIIGAVWGGVMAVHGREFGPQDLEAALVTYVGLVTLTEAGVKFLVEELRHLRG
jgi:hypothetical protein